MQCPHCGHPDSKVIDSRDNAEAVRRRRQCLRCQARFTTYEHVDMVNLFLVKADGRREEFSREKLLLGVLKACAKRPLPTGSIEALVDNIVAELGRLGRAEVPSSRVGEMVMERLRGLDRVAYIRFASVYRDFSEIDDFRAAAEALLREEEGERVPSTQLPLLPPDPAGRRQTTRARPGRR